MNLDYYGLPETEDAFTNACDQLEKYPANRRWLHAAVWTAVCSVTFQTMKLATVKSPEYRQFEAVYSRICDQVRQGKKIIVPADQGRALDITPRSEVKGKIAELRKVAG